MNQELPQEPRANPVSDVTSGGAAAAELLGALGDRPREPERECALPFWVVPLPMRPQHRCLSARRQEQGPSRLDVERPRLGLLIAQIARYNSKHEVTWESVEGTGSALEKAKTAAMRFSVLRPKSSPVLMSYFLRGGVSRFALARAWQTRICAWPREANPLYAKSFDACSRVDVRPENPKISRKELPKRNESEPPDETKANRDPNRSQGTGNREQGDLNAKSEEDLITCASKYLPGQPGLTAQNDFAGLALVAVEPQATAHLGHRTEQKQRARVLKHLRSATSVLKALNVARQRIDDDYSVDDCLHVIAVCEAESKKQEARLLRPK